MERKKKTKTIIKGYRVEKKLGSGSFGVVFKVVRLSDGRVCVMKQISLHSMSKKEVKEAIKESQLMQKLKSDFVVEYIHSFNTHGSRPMLHIIMEYCDSGDLQTLLARKKRPLDEKMVWKIFLQLLLGLEHLHSKRVIHRDIKTANIFLCQGMLVKIGDLGVARLLDTKSMAATMVGTPYYFSPELCRDQPYNNKSDVWALGCVVYECCTLRHPFEARNQGALIIKILTQPCPKIVDVTTQEDRRYSALLLRTVERMLEKTVPRRPSVKQMLGERQIQAKAAALKTSLEKRKARAKQKLAARAAADDDCAATVVTRPTARRPPNPRAKADAGGADATVVSGRKPQQRLRAPPVRPRGGGGVGNRVRGGRVPSRSGAYVPPSVRERQREQLQAKKQRQQTMWPQSDSDAQEDEGSSSDTVSEPKATPRRGDAFPSDARPAAKQRVTIADLHKVEADMRKMEADMAPKASPRPAGIAAASDTQSIIAQLRRRPTSASSAHLPRQPTTEGKSCWQAALSLLGSSAGNEWDDVLGSPLEWQVPVSDATALPSSAETAHESERARMQKRVQQLRRSCTAQLPADVIKKVLNKLRRRAKLNARGASERTLAAAVERTPLLDDADVLAALQSGEASCSNALVQAVQEAGAGIMTLWTLHSRLLQIVFLEEQLQRGR